MNNSSLIKEKSFQFALEIIEMYKYLTMRKKEFVISKQVLRSGTSIGANIEEAHVAQSKKEFIAKLNISLKEACETNYWLRLLKESGYIHKDDLLNESIELSKILTSIIKTTKKNLNTK